MNSRFRRIAAIALLIFASMISGARAHGLMSPFDCLALLSESPEKRLAVAYSKMIENHRSTFSDDAGFAESIRKALREKSYYSWENASPSETTLLRQIDAIRARKILPNGGEVDVEALDDQVRSSLEATLAKLDAEEIALKEIVGEKQATNRYQLSLKSVREGDYPLRNDKTAVESFSSADGRRLLFTNPAGELSVLDTDTGEYRNLNSAPKGPFSAFQINADGTRGLFSGEDRTLSLVDLDTGVPIWTRRGENSRTARLLEKIAPKKISTDFFRTLTPDDSFEYALAEVEPRSFLRGYHKDRQIIVREFQYLDLRDGKKLAGWETEEGIFGIRGEGPKGLVVRSEKRAFILHPDEKTGKFREVDLENVTDKDNIDCSKDGKTAWAFRENTDQKADVTIGLYRQWDAETGKIRREIPFSGKVAWKNDDRTKLLTFVKIPPAKKGLGWKSELVLWDLERGVEVDRLAMPYVSPPRSSAVAWSTDGKKVTFVTEGAIGGSPWGTQIVSWEPGIAGSFRHQALDRVNVDFEKSELHLPYGVFHTYEKGPGRRAHFVFNVETGKLLRAFPISVTDDILGVDAGKYLFIDYDRAVVERTLIDLRNAEAMKEF